MTYPTKEAIEAMTGPELLDLYNAHAAKAVKKFENRAAGIKRAEALIAPLRTEYVTVDAAWSPSDPLPGDEPLVHIEVPETLKVVEAVTNRTWVGAFGETRPTGRGIGISRRELSQRQKHELGKRAMNLLRRGDDECDVCFFLAGGSYPNARSEQLAAFVHFYAGYLKNRKPTRG